MCHWSSTRVQYRGASHRSLRIVDHPSDSHTQGLGLEGFPKQLLHGPVHMRSVGGDVPDPGSRKQPTLVAGIGGAHALVVGVEQELVGRMEGLILLQTGAEKKGFEKPRGMGAMPLGRAHV